MYSTRAAIGHLTNRILNDKNLSLKIQCIAENTFVVLYDEMFLHLLCSERI